MVRQAGTTATRRGRKRGDGEGSIFQRDDGLWRGRVRVGVKPDGRPDDRTVYAKSRGECQRKLDEVRRSASAGSLGDPGAGRETVAAYLDRWLDAIEGTVRPATLARYQVLVRKHLAPSLGRHKLGALRPEHLVALYAEKRKRLAPRTVKYLHTTIRLALAMAVKWGAVPRNVAQAVDPPKVPRKEITPPSPADVSRLLESAEAGGDRLLALWTVAVYSGCREGELLGLRWDDVDLASGALSVRRTLLGARGGEPQYGEPKTPRSRRTVGLPGDAVAALRRHLTRQKEDRLAAGGYYAEHGLIFASEIGTPLLARNVVRSFKAALKRAGLPRTIRVHDLRHSAATLMLASGVHPKVASERLGHSTVTITLDLYTHAVQGLDADAAERMQQTVRAARLASAGAG